MSEYEIFNNEDNGEVKIVPEIKKTKKEKKVVVKEAAPKKENEIIKVVKDNLKVGYLPLILSIAAIFFSLFVKFLPMISVSIGTAVIAAVFFFIGFGCAFAALIIEVFVMIKENRLEFNFKILLILLAFFVLFI